MSSLARKRDSTVRAKENSQRARPGSVRAKGCALIVVIVTAAVISASCRSAFSREYEYEEDVYLALDGSATVYVNASIPALVALRGLDLDPNPRARFDRAAVRRMFETPYTHVASLTSSRRDNRRYLHVRLDVADVARLGAAAPFAWSQYVVARDGDLLKYRQTVGPAAGRDVGNVGWTGAELVAIRLHLPSRVPFHNAPSKEIERGNIIRWEQRLSDRIKGEPIAIEAHMETQSILARTLALFGSMVALAALTFAVAIWLVMRRGRPDVPPREQEAS
jgi:hypothetical protein